VTAVQTVHAFHSDASFALWEASVLEHEPAFDDDRRRDFARLFALRRRDALEHADLIGVAGSDPEPYARELAVAELNRRTRMGITVNTVEEA
jgi:hypothetical protein